MGNDIESIVREHKAMVFSVAYNFLQDASLAEEVAQETFLRLFENRKAVVGADHLRRWLRRTATNRAIDVWRYRDRRPEIGVEEIDRPAPSPDREPDPLLEARLLRMVATLPEKARAVVILRYGEDLDASEIGEVLDMPVSTVWSHLRRGLAMLREKMSVEVEHERIGTASS
jgi:RNA polymerase sigma-70 factor (ECF subfamily)